MLFVRYPWDSEPEPAETPLPPAPASPPKPRGRRPASLTHTAARATKTAPRWLYHHLTVSGPAGEIAAFAEAARGAGVTPWKLDLAMLEEDVFLRAASQPAATRALTIAGCHILARQFRARVAAHHAKAVARIGHSRACPFDLHVLLPVPPGILALGPTHPDALAWLVAHWGTTDRPRQVCLRPAAKAGRRLPGGHTVVGYGFFTPDETPNVAVAQLRERWPGLRFLLVPRPGD